MSSKSLINFQLELRELRMIFSPSLLNSNEKVYMFVVAPFIHLKATCFFYILGGSELQIHKYAKCMACWLCHLSDPCSLSGFDENFLSFFHFEWKKIFLLRIVWKMFLDNKIFFIFHTYYYSRGGHGKIVRKVHKLYASKCEHSHWSTGC